MTIRDSVFEVVMMSSRKAMMSLRKVVMSLRKFVMSSRSNDVDLAKRLKAFVAEVKLLESE